MRQECRGLSEQFRWLLTTRAGRHQGSIRAVCQNIEETKTFHRDFVDNKIETATTLLKGVINILFKGCNVSWLIVVGLENITVITVNNRQISNAP